MTVPVEQGTRGVMRFCLPRKVVDACAPEPTERSVRVVHIPAETLVVLRFSGRATLGAREEQARLLRRVLDTAGLKPSEPPFFMGYGPPFSVPFLRRYEVAMRLSET